MLYDVNDEMHWRQCFYSVRDIRYFQALHAIGACLRNVRCSCVVCCTAVLLGICMAHVHDMHESAQYLSVLSLYCFVLQGDATQTYNGPLLEQLGGRTAGACKLTGTYCHFMLAQSPLALYCS
jgi:hypothetical protein